jgi:protein-S-isoprenylcysteine O-methyltransferase Ste14
MSADVFRAILIFGIAINKVLETFVHRNKAEGAITYKWTFFIFVCFYTITIILSLYDIIIKGRAVNEWLLGLGLVLYGGSVYLIRCAKLSLGPYHSVHIEIKTNHKLVIDGPYKYLRHPIYLATIAEILSVAFIANSMFSLLFVVSIYVPALLIRMYWEENEMQKALGAEYSNYKQRIPAFFPHFWRGTDG